MHTSVKDNISHLIITDKQKKKVGTIIIASKSFKNIKNTSIYHLSLGLDMILSCTRNILEEKNATPVGKKHLIVNEKLLIWAWKR